MSIGGEGAVLGVVGFGSRSLAFSWGFCEGRRGEGGESVLIRSRDQLGWLLDLLQWGVFGVRVDVHL